MKREVKPYRRLYRSKRDRMIAGVCAGLADYFKIDPTLVRLLFVIFLLAGGSAFLAYIILWLVVPVDPQE
ncbi:phage shock protein C, PspC (plasmid) [Legionella adelaidensis]|uniref:Phage shock protein C, PspC n=1 Tax=Legionella adelaidensis TaxID=45056 RepID=A0A0W0R174_9GAMM|nr:PspC domain-containing protein [Legionella adelaidensis]KTC64818.1 phage shock protein C, PspC [Legionella adelaidensis]VEH86192.1 phage shock protein C, PspC [Legionella adelaidensis]